MHRGSKVWYFDRKRLILGYNRLKKNLERPCPRPGTEVRFAGHRKDPRNKVATLTYIFTSNAVLTQFGIKSEAGNPCYGVYRPKFPGIGFEHISKTCYGTHLRTGRRAFLTGTRNASVVRRNSLVKIIGAAPKENHDYWMCVSNTLSPRLKADRLFSISVGSGWPAVVQKNKTNRENK